MYTGTKVATVIGVLETNMPQLSDQIKPTKQSKWTFFGELSRGSRRKWMETGICSTWIYHSE